MCDVLALRDGKALFQAVVDHEEECKTAIDVGLQTLTVAYQNAPTKSLRTQIHAQAKSEVPVKKIPRHRIRP